MVSAFMDVKIFYLPHYAGNKLGFKHPGDSGFDLPAAVAEPVVIEPGSGKLIPCGFKIEVPHGYELQVRSRSGLASGSHVFVLNSPGTVDSSYRGEVKVMLFNLSGNSFTVEPGARIAQGVVSAVPQINLVEVMQLSETSRHDGGFGSTGII